jgi:flavorubredoxin
MLPTSANNTYDGRVVTDCVEKMLAFKRRCPTVVFELASNEFAAIIPGHGRFWALSLCRLMEKLEQWEQEQRLTTDD